MHNIAKIIAFIIAIIMFIIYICTVNKFLTQSYIKHLGSTIANKGKMKTYKAEYAGGATETFEARNDADAIRRACEIAMEETHPQFYAVFLLDEEGNEIKRI